MIQNKKGEIVDKNVTIQTPTPYKLGKKYMFEETDAIVLQMLI